ncbi:LysR substrate-binding domain-containing protein [Leptospira ilyithenensis]|uniref:LysR family transcriptional regulator n=1 Tax=Leptospira ilyithenensis TaxID=2484901 RepID=A0A4R9LVM8_9LEPT|nr:LysR substrate-binding domain-containing protein [Leptospira ilyithenensis]TGN14650.1 LysR family transcriptional regulator [Leptospira ilyithenensis]
MSISIRQLEIFASVARFGSTTLAGEALVLSQSAISMALKELERGIGTPLFDRTSRELSLNEVGKNALPLCSEILDRFSELSRLRQNMDGKLSGSLRVSASTTIGNYLLPKWIGKFQSLHPQTEIILEIKNSKEVLIGIQDTHVDLGFVEGRIQEGPFQTEIFYNDEMIIIDNYKSNAKQKLISKKDMENRTWILREPGSGTREWIEYKWASEGWNPKKKRELGNTEAIKKSVEEGLGISCLSLSAVERELNWKLLSKINYTYTNWNRPLQMVWHDKKYKSELFLKFFEFCRTESKSTEITNV